MYTPKQSTPHSTPIWLSDSLLLLCYKDTAGTIQGVAIQDIDCLRDGFTSPEFSKRRSTSLLCCSLTNKEWEEKEERLLSFMMKDGSTIDVECKTVQVQ